MQQTNKKQIKMCSGAEYDRGGWHVRSHANGFETEIEEEHWLSLHDCPYSQI